MAKKKPSPSSESRYIQGASTMYEATESASGYDDIEYDGSVLGGSQRTRYATGRDPVQVGDAGLQMLRNMHTGRD